jgi:hypothetical protein
MYLRCLTGDRPRDWLRWLPWVEYVFNTAYQSSLRETPFRVVYGRDPPSIRSYEPGEMRVAAVATTMEERAEFLEDIRHRLEQGQAVQKRYYDRAHRSVSFQVGDWVLLRLRHRAAASLPQAPPASSVRSSTGHTASSSSSTTWQFVLCCPHRPDSMMCSTSGY